MTSDKEASKSKKGYSKRSQRLRRLIVATVVASCLVPTCICVILAVKYDRLKTDYEQVQNNLGWYRNSFGYEKDIMSGGGVDKTQAFDGSTTGTDTDAYGDTTYDVDYANIEVSGAENPENIEGTRYVYLTFDDGPSSNTGEILDILAEYNVKATFFVCGKPDSRYSEAYQRIVDEGHTIGMHSYSHKYSVIYESLDSFKDDLQKLREFLYHNYDVMPKYYRFPGGSSNTVSQADMKELVSCLNDEGITFFDWNVAGGDATGGATKASIYNNVVNNVPRFKHSIVLLHDAADKMSTVEALPEIIEAVQAMDDTVIVPITDDTLPVQHIKY